MYDFRPEELTPLEERDYQLQAVADVRELVRQGYRRILLCCPTGSGKTAIASQFLKLCVAKGMRGLFLAHTRELVRQACRTLARANVPYGVIMAGSGYEINRPVQVCGKDTFLSRVVRRKTLDDPPADLIIPDEAHLSMARSFQKVLALYPKAVILGLTATPINASGRGLGSWWQVLHKIASYQELIARGFLVPTRCWTQQAPSTRKVKINKGQYSHDFDKQQLQDLMDRPRLVGDLVRHWLEKGENRQTIIRAAGIRHSLSIRDEFAAAGISIEHVDGTFNHGERDAVVNRFLNRETRIITQVALLNTGADFPEAACLIDAEPTMSYRKFRQGSGRIQRSSPGKVDALYLDHAGNIIRHGLPDADVDWKLTTGGTESAYRLYEPEPFVCFKCGWTGEPKEMCPGCGAVFQHKPKGREPEHVSGLLTEVDSVAVEAQEKMATQRIWNRALGIACAKDGTLTQAAMIFYSMTDRHPWEQGLEWLKFLPGHKRWKNKVASVFPQFNRRKDKSCGS